MEKEEMKRYFNQFLNAEIEGLGGLYWRSGEQWIKDRKEVYEALKKIIDINTLTGENFLQFLQFNANLSWTGLARKGNEAIKDIIRLKNALRILLNEEEPIEKRINMVLKSNSPHHVKGLGKNIATGILMVNYPEKYGVLNEKALEGLRILGYDIKITADLGRSYLMLNEILTRLANELKTDLVYVDGFLWYICEVVSYEKKAAPSIKEEISKQNLKSNQISRLSEESLKVFIVHGHDEAMKQTVARMLEKLGFEIIILHEKPNKGRTIIEKFADYTNIGFAVVLLSPDDIAYPKENQKAIKSRARQNVIFELGYFIGKLGEERVFTLYKEIDNFEMPSDYSGKLYIPFDDNGKWQFTLARELKECGYNIDANKLL